MRRAQLAASAASLLLVQRVGAAPRGVPLADALHVEPNACFDAGSLAPVLQRWLKRDTLNPRLSVEVTGQPQSAEGLSLRVLRDGVLVGERHFPGLSAPCEDVRAAVGLATAFALDATVLESLGMKPVQPPTTPPPAPALPALPAPPAPPAPSRSWPRFDVSVEPGALFGVLPAPTAAIAPAFGVRLAPPFEIRFSGAVSAPAPLSLDGRPFEVTLLAARAEGCAAVTVSWVRGRGCAGVAAGRLLASSADPRSSVSQTVPWAAAVVRGDVRVPLSPRFGLVFGADAIVPMTRPHFVILGPTGATVASAGLPVLGGAVSFGPEITFP